MRRGEIWWASLPEPAGSEPGYRRPLVIIQVDAFNRSLISTVVVAALTSNLHLGGAPGNVVVSSRLSGLEKKSVVNVSQLLTLDRSFLTERAGRLDRHELLAVDEGLQRVLGLGPRS
ncbi:MAG: type II toxin-antitoxin system PemK/MazF family toxin [Myxococcota bacterium]